MDKAPPQSLTPLCPGALVQHGGYTREGDLFFAFLQHRDISQVFIIDYVIECVSVEGGCQVRLSMEL